MNPTIVVKIRLQRRVCVLNLNCLETLISRPVVWPFDLFELKI